MIAPITIVIPGPPVAQGRPRFASIDGRPVIHDPGRSKQWKRAAALHMFAATEGQPIPLTGPVELTVAAFWPPPRGTSGRTWRTSRPDVDNVAKAVMDAGTGVLWQDDAQIVRLVATTEHDEPARVEIRVRVL